MTRPRAFTARLACGCELAFREGVEGSPVAVVIRRKSDRCTLSIHVAGMAVYDHREALRPSTRPLPPIQPDYDEG